MMHVVMFSGGVGSWAAAKRVVDLHGAEHVTLLFADTLVEADDLHTFLRGSAAALGAPLVVVADGRTPFQVFRDKRFLGNARLASCSDYLKQRPCREWLEEFYPDPVSATVHVGIDWSEIHRLPAVESGWAPYAVSAPLCEAPFLTKDDMLAQLAEAGIAAPTAYADGFPHNNCLNQGCVRGGQAYWERLLRNKREVYLRTEADEEELRAYLDKDVAILRDRSGGTSRPLSLREFRERVEAKPALFDGNEWGGCGCFVEGP